MREEPAPYAGNPSPYGTLWEPERPAAKPLLIEIPPADKPSAPKTLPPAIFVLANGERLEAQRFVLTASNLSVTVNRKVRTVPVDMIDLDTTISANRERGIDLRIPADRNEIFVSF